MAQRKNAVKKRIQNLPVQAQTPTLISRQATIKDVSNSSDDDFSPRDLDSDTDESKLSEDGCQLEGEDKDDIIKEVQDEAGPLAFALRLQE
jgi:hypothetical protein